MHPSTDLENSFGPESTARQLPRSRTTTTPDLAASDQSDASGETATRSVSIPYYREAAEASDSWWSVLAYAHALTKK